MHREQTEATETRWYYNKLRSRYEYIDTKREQKPVVVKAVTNDALKKHGLTMVNYTLMRQRFAPELHGPVVILVTNYEWAEAVDQKPLEVLPYTSKWTDDL